MLGFHSKVLVGTKSLKKSPIPPPVSDQIQHTNWKEEAIKEDVHLFHILHQDSYLITVDTLTQHYRLLCGTISETMTELN